MRSATESTETFSQISAANPHVCQRSPVLGEGRILHAMCRPNTWVQQYIHYVSTISTDMPVRIEDFETGDVPQGPSVPEQVVAYLYTHQDRAFTRAEIATRIDETPNAVGTALSRLKQRNLVRHRGEYWAITDDRERVADAYDLHSIMERLDEADGGIDADNWDAAAPDEPHPSERDT